MPGQLVLVAGPIRFYHGRQMAPRELVVLGDADDTNVAGRIIPVYPATEGLSHKQIRAIINQHLDAMIAIVPDILPAALRERFNLPSLPDALHAVHRPDQFDRGGARPAPAGGR